MYLQFFGFSNIPFSDTPDVRQFWEDHASHELFKALLQGLMDGYRLQIVTAEPGLGKSMLCRRLLNSLRSHKARYDVQFMPFPNLRLGHMLDQDLLKGDTGRHRVLLIDEAQSLSMASLLTLTAALQQAEQHLQAVLFAQPELDTRLHSTDLAPMRELIAQHYRLEALTEAETATYIRARIELAGKCFDDIMDRCLIPQIWQITGGVPRLINTLMRKALLHAYETQSPRLTAQHVEQAAMTTAAVAAVPKH